MRIFYLTKSRFLLAFSFLIATLSSVVFGQNVNTYGFTSSSGTYTSITGTSILAAATDDGVSALTNIGFNFSYNGAVFTQFAASSNGFIQLGAVPSAYTYTPISSIDNTIAFMARDGKTNQDVVYSLSGTAPNQVLTIQFVQQLTYANTTDIINAQIKLYETSNVVQIVYGTPTAATAYTPQVGLRAAATNFSNRTTTTAWASSTAGAVNNATMAWSASITPATGLTYTWTPPPATPPTPTQDPTPPTCATGTNLDLAGPAPTNVVWYWQTSATGTSMTNPYSGPYTVFSNSTYYARAYDTSSMLWSISSSSYVVSNFPVATAPTNPAAAVQNPACVTTGTDLIADPAPIGYTFYWQGTNSTGASQLLDASTPYHVSTSGTYYLNAYETASSCWSTTVATPVTINSYIPVAPTATPDEYNICSNSTTLPITATAPASSSPLIVTIGTNLSNPGTLSVPFNVSALPAGATITSAVLNLTNVNAINGSWRSEIRVAISGAYTLAPTQISALTGGGAITPDPSINLAAFPVNGGAMSLNLSETYDDGGATTIDATFGQVQLVISYTLPSSTITWYDATTGGNVIGTGSPFESVGTTVLSNPTTLGDYSFYAGSSSGGCNSVANTLVTIHVADVNADLIPVDASCNGAANGSFTLGTVNCGQSPFTYSVDGGVFGPIPTNLIAGTYSVVIQDAGTLLSSPITVVIGQPAVPSGITFPAINYYTADIAWTTTGDEIQWNVEFGPVGFTPGSGTSQLANSTTYTITGLQPDTDYDVYVTPICGTNPQSAGPVVLSTNPGFFTYDSDCGPGFINISGTGTALNTTDDSQAGVTLPWPWNVNGVAVNTISVGNNGGVLFNTLTGYVGYTSSANGMFPYIQDLNTPTGGVYYESIGTAPNRQFIIMWDDMPHYSTSGGATFEIIVDEATSEVYFIYDDVMMNNVAYDYGADAEIVINTANGNAVVSMNNATYLTNNSCVHFYNSLCPNPVIQTSTVLQEEIIIDWNAGAYGETAWTVIYGPAGFDPLSSGTTISTTNSDVDITGLTQLTEYDVYIYSECTIDNLTSGGLLYTNTTLPWCNTPTGLGGTTAVDSIFTTWNFAAVPSAPQSLSSFNLQYGTYGFDLYNGSMQVATGTDNADTIATSLLAGGVYQYYVQAVCGTDTSNYAGPFTVVAPITNDAVCTPQMLNVDGTVYVFNNTGATAQTGEGAIITGSNPAGYNGTILPMMAWGSPAIEGSNWYTFIAPASGSLWFSGQDEDYFASQIAIYQVGTCNDFSTFNLIAASDQTDVTIANKVAPYFTVCGLTPGATYYVLHDAWSNGFGGAANFGQYSIKMTEIVLEAGNYVNVLNACTGSSVELFDGIANNDAGGVWTSTNTSLNQGITGSTFNSVGFAFQNYQFQYTVTEGCAYDTILSQVTIYPPSSAGTNGQINACKNQPLNLLSGLSGLVDLGGTWYNPSNVALPSGQISSGNLPGQFNYNYITGNGVCPNDTSNIILNVSATCDWTGIDELSINSIDVHPNPSTGLFFITNTDPNQNFNFQVVDLNGRSIVENTNEIIGSASVEVDLSRVENGMYMIRLFNNAGSKLVRVVKQ